MVMTFFFIQVRVDEVDRVAVRQGLLFFRQEDGVDEIACKGERPGWLAISHGLTRFTTVKGLERSDELTFRALDDRVEDVERNLCTRATVDGFELESVSEPEDLHPNI
jgi:hypothetical protein